MTEKSRNRDKKGIPVDFGNFKRVGKLLFHGLCMIPKPKEAKWIARFADSIQESRTKTAICSLESGEIVPKVFVEILSSATIKVGNISLMLRDPRMTRDLKARPAGKPSERLIKPHLKNFKSW